MVDSISLDPALCCDVAVAMWRFTWPSLRAQDVKKISHHCGRNFIPVLAYV